jgi:hypothetical protein
MSTIHLSKSAFTRGLQCHKSLYLKKHHPELEDPVSEAQQAVFSGGTRVGLLAQQLFPGGIDLGDFIPDNFQKAFSETELLLSRDQVVIYEAGFKTDNLLCFIDILTKKDGRYQAYEVKGSSSVKDIYLWDTAFQYHVMTSAGIVPEDIFVIYLNTSYVKQGELDVKQLFTIESVKDRILPLIPQVKEQVRLMNAMLANVTPPAIDIGPHCSTPYGCSFTGHCWKHLPKDSLFSYKGLKSQTQWSLYKQGVYKVEDIPETLPLNRQEQLVVYTQKNQTTHINREAIRNFLSNLNYPLYFLDFETLFMVSIPIYDNSSPFQQIPFQYSLHIKNEPHAEVVHKQFLAQADPYVDPREAFIRQLIDELGTSGDILVYNATFEKGRLKEIQRQMPQFATAIDPILRRVVDLMKPFQSRHYYTPEMKGSFSIKKVLPALVPGLSYEGMDIADGGAASQAFMSLFDETDAQTITKTRNDLLKYCGLDTWAMVEIVRKLNTI